MITNACEDIEDLAFPGQRVANAVRRQQGKLKRFGERDRLLVYGFLLAIVVTL